ncbi:FxDxF family PEP-CTERM protein [Nitrosomonas oligotropha]|uniref:FxDxF family PEP-CTERM protein n=1 Tax=Nitrosomonas oligotropha TaxID=42354 RepID=UPI0013697FDD|nr:FxDxF family PEP-CTERM protein [Nitrosomonas oligotropha]
MNKKIIFSVMFFAFSCPVNAAWEVRSIDAIPNSVSWATDINDSGIMVGEIKNNPNKPIYEPGGKLRYTFDPWNTPSHPFMTGENGVGLKIFDIEGRAEAINNAGQVIGKSSAGAVFMTGPNGEGLTYLDYARDAYDINNSGQIVGVTKSGHGFITGSNGIGMTDLGPVVARAINDSGQVAGWFYTGDEYGLLSAHAFITGANGIGMTDIGRPTEAFYGTSTRVSILPYDINNSGQVVGLIQIHIDLGYVEAAAFMTDSDGTNIRILSTSWGAAFGINDSGQIVTSSNVLCENCGIGEGISFLLDHGKFTNISNQFSVDALSLFDAAAINNNGQIAGTGVNAGGAPYGGWHAFMVSSDSSSTSPVPEPSTYAMLLAGLGLLGFMSRRRKV